MPKLTTRLCPQFYLSEDVTALSQSLLGKYLVTELNGQRTAGMIVETEAYRGTTDKASHAYNNRRTSRTETMYQQGGVGYIYLCYGIHHLFNIVTASENIPHAILIRAIEPKEGLSSMLKRRKMTTIEYRLCSGPGTLTQALGITIQLDGCCLNTGPIGVEDHGIHFSNNEIIASPRVGIAYAQEHALLPWRFRIKHNPWAGKD